jgi:hypothetical protein
MTIVYSNKQDHFDTVHRSKFRKKSVRKQDVSVIVLEGRKVVTQLGSLGGQYVQ